MMGSETSMVCGSCMRPLEQCAADHDGLGTAPDTCSMPVCWRCLYEDRGSNSHLNLTRDGEHKTR